MDPWRVAFGAMVLAFVAATVYCAKPASAQPKPSAPLSPAPSAKPSPPSPAWRPLVVSPANCPTCGLGPEGGVAWPLAEAQRIHALLRAESLAAVVRVLPQLQTDLEDREEALAETQEALAEERAAKDAFKSAVTALEAKAGAERERADSLASAVQHTREALKAAVSASESSLWAALKWTALVAGIAAGIAVVAYTVREIRAAVGSSSSLLSSPLPRGLPLLRF